MKRILLSFAFLFSVLIATAQDACLNDVVNTLKDRISLAGYAQVGYTYDDADDGSNTFDIKRVIFMAQGKITDRWLCYFMYSFANTGKILEAYTEYKFLPQLTARIGQFKTMYTIENPMSPCYVELINCYAQSITDRCRHQRQRSVIWFQQRTRYGSPDLWRPVRQTGKL